jgi:hypothetical protein
MSVCILINSHFTLNSLLYLPPKFVVYSVGLQLRCGKMWRIQYVRSQALSRVFLVSPIFYSFKTTPYQSLLQRDDLTPFSSLPNSIPPHEIQQRLAELICRFITPLNVKIINDKMGNKAAFVQTKVGVLHIWLHCLTQLQQSNDDANLLINSQLYLDGKILRLELARAHRTLVLSFKDTEVPPPKLRIIRNFAGCIRYLSN